MSQSIKQGLLTDLPWSIIRLYENFLVQQFCLPFMSVPTSTPNTYEKTKVTKNVVVAMRTESSYTVPWLRMVNTGTKKDMRLLKRPSHITLSIISGRVKSLVSCPPNVDKLANRNAQSIILLDYLTKFS